MKKVLVIDDPKTCRNCFACAGEICKAANRKFPESGSVLLEKCDNYCPIWCPLRDMPEHKMDWRAGDGGYESGWNDCLDKIGGCRR